MDLIYEKYLEITGKKGDSLLEGVLTDDFDEALFEQCCYDAILSESKDADVKWNRFTHDMKNAAGEIEREWTGPSLTNTIKAYIQKAGDKISSTAIGSKVVDKTGMGSSQMAQATMATIALTALLAYGAAKTYKRFFSAAAKACSGKSGDAKTACMQAYKIKALQAQIKDLEKGSKACAKAKEPNKCKAVISKKLNKLQDKLQKLK